MRDIREENAILTFQLGWMCAHVHVKFTSLEFVKSQVTENKIKFIKHFIHFTVMLIIMTIYTDSKNFQTLPGLLLHKTPKYLERPYITKWIFFS